VASDGAQGNDYSTHPSISADGRYVAFESDASNLVSGETNGIVDVFVHDRQSGQTTRVSVASDGTQGNSGSYYGSYNPSISADGRYVAFHSHASNLVSGDTNGIADIFVHEKVTNYTISGNAGVDGATLSYTDFSAKTATSAADGSYSFSVSYNWSGSVTPSKTGYTFSPTHHSYTNVLVNQTGQNYTAAIAYQIYLPLVIR
jgi:Tol biopolymer transport system component